MKVGFARAAAKKWVSEHAEKGVAFRGAYFSGSTIRMSADLDMPATSDVDVVIVTSDAEPPPKLGKLIYEGVLIEVTYLPLNLLHSAEEVLTSYHLAGSFAVDTIIADPTGYLRELQKEVSSHFAKYPWVRRRCENVRQKIETGLLSMDPSAPWHDKVTGWLFPTGVTTHLVLTAALRNPTVRLRYLAARDALFKYGYDSLYDDLLKLLGCFRLAPQTVERHLSQLASTFDATVIAAKTPFPFSADITAEARPVAIDGSRELIRAGCHREAVFWIVATFARCHKILHTDAPHLHHSFMPLFNGVMADLGIHSQDDLAARGERVMAFLPRLWETAEEILLANPDITAKPDITMG